MVSSTTAVISVCLLLVALGWLAAKKRFLLFLLSFLWVGYGWRLVSTVYLDIAGPVYSTELFREIGGGHAALVLALSMCVVVVAVLVVFSSRATARLAGIQPLTGALSALSSRAVRRLLVAGLVVYISLLWIDLVRIGEIPILTGTEEFIYTRDYAGLIHRMQLRFGNIIAFMLGLFYVDPTLTGRRPDRKFLIAFVLILAYMLVTGHRYSAFYSYTAFFIMPFAAISLRRQFQRHDAQPRGAIPGLRTELVVIVLAVAAMIVFAVSRSLVSYGVSRDDAARAYLTQRILVHQGQLWWGTFERIFLLGQYDPAGAVAGVFVDPIDPERNTTTPYLMQLEIGDAATYRIVEQDSVYSGGFPEIAFELFGPYLAFVMIFAVSLLTGGLLLLLMEGIFLRQPVRVFLTVYVLYALILFHASGMVNFLVNWKFWLKVSALAVWLLLEALDLKLVRSRRMLASTAPTGPRLS